MLMATSEIVLVTLGGPSLRMLVDHLRTEADLRKNKMFETQIEDAGGITKS
jgi:hypothetical protein